MASRGRHRQGGSPTGIKLAAPSATLIRDPEPPTQTGLGVPANGMRRIVMRAAAWTTLAQIVPVAVNIALTPMLIKYLTLDGYGLYVLANTVVLFFGSFDGGIGAGVGRYSAVYAGVNDRRSATRLVTSMAGVVAVIASSGFVVLLLSASSVLSLMHVPGRLAGPGKYLLISLAVVVASTQLRTLFAAQLSARQKYGAQSAVAILSYGVYVVGVLLTMHVDAGLRGIANTLIVQAIFQLLFVSALSIRYFDRRAIGFMSKSEISVFIKFALRVQATALTGIVSNQADAFIVGKFLSVGAVGLYGAGSSFAMQLRQVLFNVLAPMSTTIARGYGQGGEAEANRLFGILQRRWVHLCSAWSAVGVAATYFGIQAWLGPSFRPAAEVGAVLTAAYAIHMWTGTLTALLTSVGRPEIEVRYAYLAAGVNIVLTIPLLLFFGLIGVVIGTGTSLVVASIAYIRFARQRYNANLPSFFRQVPIIPSLCTIACVAFAEYVFRNSLPRGGVGLLLSGAIAVPGFAVFALVHIGPSGVNRQVESLRSVLRARRA